MDLRQVGPYSITRELGRGGMGVVYLARDERLDRDVAIKALPEQLAKDPDRLARFEREAKTLAQLNHPSVAGIYGVEAHEGNRYLVLEYVEGETLAARLKRGPLPADEAVELAVQIAEGVEAAHESGVIHRDLKPGNVIVTPGGKAKVLDFGLARASDAPSSAVSLSPDSPTITAPVAQQSPTMPGIILGTAAYMSPEQARGRQVDRRTDIWSFGVMLLEMLIGRNPFQGDTVTDCIAAVVNGPLGLDRLPSATPPQVARVLRRCLSRDPGTRYHSIIDASLDLRETDMAPAARTRSSGGVPAAAMGAVLTALIALALWLAWAPEQIAPKYRTPRKFQIADVRIPSDPFAAVAISPDGTLVAVRERIHGVGPSLAMHDLRTGERKPVGDRWAGGWAAEFSPDGRRLMAYLEGELRLVDVRSGAARTVSMPPTGFNGGCWLDNGTFLFAGADGPELFRLTIRDGSVKRLELDELKEYDVVATPNRVRGRNAVLLSVIRERRFDIAALDLDSGSVTALVSRAHAPLHTASGHILFQSGDEDEDLLAAPFDADNLRLAGPTTVVADIAARSSRQERAYSVSDEGTLAFLPAGAGDSATEIAWLDRNGAFERIASFERTIDNPRISPEGRRIAFRAPAPNCSIHVHDLDRNTTSLITRGGDNHGIAWSADGRSILTMRRVGTAWSVFSVPADGSADATRLTGAELPRGVNGELLPDGSGILVAVGLDNQWSDIGVLNLENGEYKPLLDSDADEDGPALSPSGTVLAYWSDESGDPQVYVRRFPQLDQRIQVSPEGGKEPVWSEDGERLYFKSGDRMMSVDVTSEPALSVTSAVEAFQSEVWKAGFFVEGGVGLAGYDVSADGSRIVVVRTTDPDRADTIQIITDWLGLLPRSNN